MSPFYEIPWPVLLATGGAVVLLCLAAYVLGFYEGREEERGRDWWRPWAAGGGRGRGGDDRGNWRW